MWKTTFGPFFNTLSLIVWKGAFAIGENNLFFGMCSSVTFALNIAVSTDFPRILYLLVLALRNVAPKNNGVVVVSIAQRHSTKPELRFCALEIRDGEDLWQWSLLEIRLNALKRCKIHFATLEVRRANNKTSCTKVHNSLGEKV